MAGSLATPDKGNSNAVKLPSSAAMLTTDHDTIGSASSVKHASLHEPSPASTYGGTAGSASVPATPQEHHDHDPVKALAESMKAAALDDSIQYISVSDSQGQRQSQLNSNSIRRIVPAGSSPSSSNGVARFGPGFAPSDNSSPTTSRHREIMQSPSWRRGEGFVRQSAGVDDPFVSSRAADRSPSQADESPFRPREDRAGIQLSGDNAQAILPPNACVFVANLVSTKTDEQLEYSVTNAFQMFGNCYVKIRRDNKGMPFAFCQYENVADAQRAITCGRGMEVDGRACRTEVAKVNRSLYLSKVTGETIPEDEARRVMSRFGALERVWFCTQTDKEMFRLPEGIWIMFAFFQDCRDAQAGFRDHNLYRLEQPRMPDEIRARMANRAFESPIPSQRTSPGLSRRPFVSPQASLRNAIDLSSIFVGNLPSNVTEEMLRTTFGAYGSVRNVEVVRKPSVNPSGMNVFAFIEYSSYGEASFATSRCITLQGNRLRVEHKESADQTNRRNLTMMSGGSPRARYIADNQEALAMLFQRGVSVGMANAAAQSQVLPATNYGSAGYPYYPHYSQSQYGPYVSPPTTMDPESPSNMQVNGNIYMPSVMGHLAQMQYPSAPPQYVQYPQYQPGPPPRSNYQWPPPASSADNENAPSAPATTSNEGNS